MSIEGQSSVLSVSEWDVSSYSVRHMDLDTMQRDHQGYKMQSNRVPNNSLNVQSTVSPRSSMQDSSEYYSKNFMADGSVVYNCHICGQMLESSALLQRHMNMLHKNVGALPFLCPICQQGFFSYGGMRTHRLTHCAGRKHTCEICGYKFLYKHHLKRHEIGVHKMSRCSKCLKLIDIAILNYHQVNCT